MQKVHFTHSNQSNSKTNKTQAVQFECILRRIIHRLLLAVRLETLALNNLELTVKYKDIVIVLEQLHNQFSSTDSSNCGAYDFSTIDFMFAFVGL